MTVAAIDRMTVPYTGSNPGPASKRIIVGYGFWIFLLSDFVMFSAFFAAYAVLSEQTAGGPSGTIGPLLTQVPPPLGFGTVLLEDGPCLGFLAETAGLMGAADITQYGGWRAWLAANAGD